MAIWKAFVGFWKFCIFFCFFRTEQLYIALLWYGPVTINVEIWSDPLRFLQNTIEIHHECFSATWHFRFVSRWMFQKAKSALCHQTIPPHQSAQSKHQNYQITTLYCCFNRPKKMGSSWKSVRRPISFQNPSAFSFTYHLVSFHANSWMSVICVILMLCRSLHFSREAFSHCLNDPRS